MEQNCHDPGGKPFFQNRNLVVPREIQISDPTGNRLHGPTNQWVAETEGLWKLYEKSAQPMGEMRFRS